MVVLDLSCSSAATTRRPTASSTDRRRQSKTPYAALHDIDANKPGGSIKIRVKTYAHSAQAPRGAPRGRGKQEATSSRTRIDKKRLELLELKATQLERRAASQDPALEQQIEELRAKLAGLRAARRSPMRSPSRPKGIVQLEEEDRRTGTSSRRQHVKRRDERR